MTPFAFSLRLAFIFLLCLALGLGLTWLLQRWLLQRQILDFYSSSVELGVKFTSGIDGTVTGLRFYKGSQNTGTHVADLWNAATGALVATATFTNEGASGWQQVNFSSPVAIAATRRGP